MGGVHAWYHAGLDRGRRPAESTSLIERLREARSKEVPGMTLRLGDTAPDFTADSTAGPIEIHEGAGFHRAIDSRNLDGTLRVIDPLPLTDRFEVATPADWKQGENVEPSLRLTPAPDR
jgi:hypothetical protein